MNTFLFFYRTSYSQDALHPETFFLVMLPPIMFDAGFTLHKGYFFKNIISIFVLAVFGTIISTFVVGAGLYVWGALPGMTFVHCLMYGALIR